MHEAERLLREGLMAAGLEAKELSALMGSDARKVAIAHVIWSQTTVGMSWLAEHLVLKSAANASQQLRRWKCRKMVIPAALREWMKHRGSLSQ